jgi:hypothetical protein
MGKYIDQSDLNNNDLEILAIRRGCSGICACLGTCRSIIGYIDRKDYNDYLSTYKTNLTFDEFLNKDNWY